MMVLRFFKMWNDPSLFPRYKSGRVWFMTPRAETRKLAPKTLPPIAMAFLTPVLIVHFPKTAADIPPAAS